MRVRRPATAGAPRQESSGSARRATERLVESRTRVAELERALEGVNHEEAELLAPYGDGVGADVEERRGPTGRGADRARSRTSWDRRRVEYIPNP